MFRDNRLFAIAYAMELALGNDIYMSEYYSEMLVKHLTVWKIIPFRSKGNSSN